MKKYSATELRSLPNSALIHIIKEMQRENQKLLDDKNSLLRTFQGYKLGITQMRAHINRVLARTKEIDKMEIGIEI